MEQTPPITFVMNN